MWYVQAVRGKNFLNTNIFADQGILILIVFDTMVPKCCPNFLLGYKMIRQAIRRYHTIQGKECRKR